MSESQAHKNKKVKKKPETNPVSDNSARDAQKCVTSNNDGTKQNTLKEASTKDTGITAEGATNCHRSETEESTGKKKKKSKKKSKEVLKETFPENKSSESLLNFSENGIHLVNHPEISVTIADAACDSNFVKVKSKETEVKSVAETDKVASFDKEKQENAVPKVAPEASKKKKNKKKKKSISNEVPPTTTTTTTLITTPTSTTTNEAMQNTIPTPTYTKVITPDNTCVLVVNNEKFSIDSKPAGNSENIKIKSENHNYFSIPSEKQLGSVLLTKNTSSDPNIQFGSSVSIFPVLTNSSADQKSINASCSLEETCNASSVNIKEEGKDNLDESKLTKSQLKAERRAKQEAQRAAKLAKSNTKTESTSSVNDNKNVSLKEKTAPKTSLKPVENVAQKSSSKVYVEKESLHKMKFFSHLPQYKHFDINAAIHPAILEIGFQYNKGIICGSNARCVALLGALKEVIKDFAPEPGKNFCRELESSIQSYLSFLSNCRPLSVSMINAVKFLKHEINRMPSETDIEQIKKELYESICNFVKINILIAREAIGSKASYKILNGDVILVYGFSSLVRDVLCKAHTKEIEFRVIVVDSRPKLEGLKMLRCLVKQGLQCSYLSINAISYIMKEVSKVIIGAHALISNGCVMSRIGNKQIALVASTYDVPVFVCCESYKFCDRADTDSFVHNELGNPADIIASSHVSNDSLKNWQELPTLQPLNLLHDITPPDLLSGLITEKCVLPCTSVPVLLRVKGGALSQ